tara:strand:+ start:55 stop:285 length:231 start_codon:yes stop_codon:yes gene_type:complete
MKKVKYKFSITQLEFFNAIERAKQRESIKDSFYLKQLEDDLAKEKWEKDFWYNKYKNLKNEIGLFFPKKGFNNDRN